MKLDMEARENKVDLKNIILGNIENIHLYLGNLREFHRGLITFTVHSDESDLYKISFHETTDYVSIVPNNEECNISEGVYSILDSQIIEDIKKRAYGLADHLDFFHYLIVSKTKIINIVVHKPIDIVAEVKGEKR